VKVALLALLLAACVPCDDAPVVLDVATESSAGVDAPCVDGDPCDDGTECTVRDECYQGECVGSLITCDDGDMCTRNVCSADNGCVAIAITAGICGSQ